MNNRALITSYFAIASFERYDERLLEILSACQFFKDYCPQELLTLCQYAHGYKVYEGQVLLSEGKGEGKDEGYLCIIIEGLVEISKQTDDGEKVITQLSSGKMMGEISVIDGLPFSATAIVCVDSIVVMISRVAIGRIELTHPQLGLKLHKGLTKTISSRLRQTTDMLAACLNCVGDLTVSLDKAIQTSEHKTNFLSEISHELRTPLNAIIGYSEILEETAEEMGHSEYVSDAHRIHQSGEHLLTLINNLLDLNKVEAGKTELYITSFDLNQLLNEVKSTIKPMLDKNNNTIDIHCDENIMMASDKIKINQILLNLLSNACKFTRHGKISVDVIVEDDMFNESIIFKVKDTGIGISESQLKKIFKPYQQANNTITQHYGGTGLGLSIIDSYVTMLRGSIAIESTVKVGTEFIVRLPYTHE